MDFKFASQYHFLTFQGGNCMAGKAAIDAVNAIHDALKGLEPADQVRAIQAAITVLGITAASIGWSNQGGGDDGAARPPLAGAGPTVAGGGAPVGTAGDYFRIKEPRGLIEALAVAARYREINERATTHTKEQLERVFADARHDPPANFPRDLANAKKQRYFNRGKDIVLSSFGQRYVEALPDRKAAKIVPRPKKPAGRKRKGKAAAK